jgi:hypothetical protein
MHITCYFPAAPEGRSRIASKYKKREEARREIRDDELTRCANIHFMFPVGTRITRIHHDSSKYNEFRSRLYPDLIILFFSFSMSPSLLSLCDFYSHIRIRTGVQGVVVGT